MPTNMSYNTETKSIDFVSINKKANRLDCNGKMKGYNINTNRFFIDDDLVSQFLSNGYIMLEFLLVS